MKPTVRDVASKANVSVATISRIINNKGGYSKETEKKVLKVIEEMGYEINAVARGLATKNTNIIGVLIPDAATSVFGEVLNGVEDIARKNGYSVLMCNTGDNGERAFEYIKVLTSNQVAGLIYTSSPLFDECYELINKMNIPSILALTISYKYQVPYVKVDDRQASYAAMKYLIERGHTKIALISGNQDDIIAAIPRKEGYLQALSDYGLNINEKLIVYGDFTYESGVNCMEKLLDSGEEFSAVFAQSDDMAVGALNVAHYRDIKVPDEISFIGYDNTKISTMSYPNLTTVAQPLFQLGQKATKNLLKVMSGEKVGSSILPYQIMERSSVKELLKT